MTSTDELERLLAEATPGPWEGRMVPAYATNPAIIGVVSVPNAIEVDRTWKIEDARLICAAVNALPELVALRKEAAFLLERLADFDRSGDTMTDDGQRDWYGHVLPSLSRLRAALNQEPGQ